MGDRNAKYRGGSREGRDDSWMFNRSSGGGRGRNRKMDRWKRNVSNTYQRYVLFHFHFHFIFVLFFFYFSDLFTLNFPNGCSMLERRSCQFFSQLLTCPLGLLVFITVSFLIYLLPFLEGGSLPFWIIQAVVCLLVSMIWIVCTAIIGFLYPWGPGGCCSISCAVPAGFFTGTIAGFWYAF